MIFHRRRLYLTAAFLAAASLGLGQAGTITNVSAANYRPIVAPDSIVAAWGSNFTATTTSANVTNSGNLITLPPLLGTVQLSVVDSSKAVLSPSLYLISPGQINYVLPANTALGVANITLQGGSSQAQGTALVSNVSPGIFTADGSGTGVPAAQVVRATANGQVTTTSTALSGTATYQPSPINIGSDQVYIVLYGTGIRRHSLNPVIATINGTRVPVAYAGAQSQYPGLDQVNVGPLPKSLASAGTVDLILTVDGVPANTVKVAIQ